jgi:hypothetical protein
MEVQQMMELLLKDIIAIHAEMDVDRKKDKEEMPTRMNDNMKSYQEVEADHKELLARLEDDRQAERRFLKEMMLMTDTGHKEIMAEIKTEMTSIT